MTYIITLRSGVRLHGTDERYSEDLLAAVASPADDDDSLPTGWLWLAEHYLLASEIVGIEAVRTET